jgi:hypothetical protein
MLVSREIDDDHADQTTRGDDMAVMVQQWKNDVGGAWVGVSLT